MYHSIMNHDQDHVIYNSFLWPIFKNFLQCMSTYFFSWLFLADRCTWRWIWWFIESSCLWKYGSIGWDSCKEHLMRWNQLIFSECHQYVVNKALSLIYLALKTIQECSTLSINYCPWFFQMKLGFYGYLISLIRLNPKNYVGHFIKEMYSLCKRTCQKDQGS